FPTKYKFLDPPLILPKDPNFREILQQLANDFRYMPYFKIIFPEEDQMHYRRRKGIPTINASTTFLTGWEGTRHDSRIFLVTISDPKLKLENLRRQRVPKVIKILDPYPKTRYHSEFHGANPRGMKEVFNHAYLSIRNKMPKYSSKDQNKIISSCFALYNYIRRSKVSDLAFRLVDKEPNFFTFRGT
ncbi:Phosphate import ATP-binding protein PstB 1, partial [Bienertia sinuspersici]